jgi:hypothetical protein
MVEDDTKTAGSVDDAEPTDIVVSIGIFEVKLGKNLYLSSERSFR